MIKAVRAIATASLLLATPGLAAAAEEPAFTPGQEQAVRDLVRDYLVTHPEVLIEALQAYEQQQQLAAEARQREAVAAQHAALSEDANSPVLGNPEGDVLIVEFFDYRCPYCRSVAPKILDAVRADGGVRLVMKEFPILGPESVYAARAALAAAMQDKYEDFHFGLMAVDGEITEQSVLGLAEELGLDVERLQKDMLSDEIDVALRDTYRLAEALEIRGTPAFVVGDTLVPGALELEALQDLIAKTRAKSS